MHKLLTAAFLTVFVLSSGGLSRAQDSAVKEFKMSVQEKVITLLGEPKKEATVWAYALDGEDGTVPGPVIRVNVGDLVRVHFTNTHTLPHSVHFHGIHPFNMDGNGQRALGKEQLQLPGESYTYEFMAVEPGYYLYHCHFNTAVHIDHGMYGLFIIEDSNWPRVDRELITFWDEWDLNEDGEGDVHTINTRSAPDYEPFEAIEGEKVRLVLANMGWDLHTPHLHGQTWDFIDSGNLRTALANTPNGVVSIGPAEIKIVEFTARHEGTWLFHCHVVPHVADDGQYPRGMLTVLKVTPDRAEPGRADTRAQDEVGMASPSPEKEADTTEQRHDLAQVASLVGDADRGFDLFDAYCKSCHAAFAQGEYGPKLAGNPILQDPDRFWATVLHGRGQNMPAWKNTLAPEQIADILAWLKSLE